MAVHFLACSVDYTIVRCTVIKNMKKINKGLFREIWRLRICLLHDEPCDMGQKNATL